jgi:ribosomal protein S18 acetylase RimI-like enzyme
VRGQKLFVRPIEPGDADAVRQFLAAHANCDTAPAYGLIGKLVGELVAVMAIDVSVPGTLQIESLVVAPDYRRKRVGRVMIREVESLAARMERDWLVVEPAVEAQQFLHKVGFVEDGVRMVRRVRR